MLDTTMETAETFTRSSSKEWGEEGIGRRASAALMALMGMCL
jgi:hypothetical protein